MPLFLKAAIRLSDLFFDSRALHFPPTCERCLNLKRSLYLYRHVKMPGKNKIEVYLLDLTLFNSSRVQQHDLKYDWHKLMRQQDANTNTHEQAFLVICWHLQSKCLVTDTRSLYDTDEMTGFDRLEEKIRQKIVKNDVAKCQLWCIFSIRNRASFWKSALKVVVQFMDLWIRYNLEENPNYSNYG